jgi:hypothetical protein
MVAEAIMVAEEGVGMCVVVRRTQCLDAVPRAPCMLRPSVFVHSPCGRCRNHAITQSRRLGDEGIGGALYAQAGADAQKVGGDGVCARLHDEHVERLHETRTRTRRVDKSAPLSERLRREHALRL